MSSHFVFSSEFDRFVESLNSSVKFDFPDKHSFLSISTDKIDGETEDDHKDHRVRSLLILFAILGLLSCTKVAPLDDISCIAKVQ